MRNAGRGRGAGREHEKEGESGAVRLEVKAKPKAKKSRIVALEGGTVEVALAAPPVDGAANEELVRFLSEVLSIPKRSITLLRGQSSRTKLLSLTGLSPSDLTARLQAAIQP